jgi:hypothetical protein
MRSQILAVHFLILAVYPTQAAFVQPGAVSIADAQLARYARPGHFQFTVVVELGAQAHLGVEGAAPATLARIPERLIEGTHTTVQAIAERVRILGPTALLEYVGHRCNALAGQADSVGRGRLDGRRAAGRINGRGSPPGQAG